MSSEHIKTQVLLVNLGSPESTATSDVRRFLRRFLSDPRVVNLPRPLWLPILHLFVLPFRPRKSAEAYRSIWTDSGSPLLVHTQNLADRLGQHFQEENIRVDYAMSYSPPDIEHKLTGILQAKPERLIVLPLYPQYSSTTSASVFDAVVERLKKEIAIPSLSWITDFHQHPRYIHALADSIRQAWAEQAPADKLVFSFHGLPKLLIDRGDPYFHQCQTTARLVAQALQLPESRWQLVFQSRFGKAEWLKPYCVDTLTAYPKQGIKSVDIVCPGFSVDCLETLEEIAVENRDLFLEAGGEHYRYIPCLNDSEAQVTLLTEIIRSNLAGQ